jgi:hypothetical protein
MFKMKDLLRRGPGTFAGSLDDEHAINTSGNDIPSETADPEVRPDGEPDSDADDSFSASMGREAALNNQSRPRKLF